MRCSSCSKSLIVQEGLASVRNKVKAYSPCDYTKELVALWKTKMICIINNNYLEQVGITKKQMNGFMGVINTIVVFNNQPCTYQSTLDKIQDIIIKTIDLGICQ